MKLFEAIARELARLGVDAVFGLMGDDNAPLIAYMTEACGIRYYGVRHETTAVLMADGYARTTGRVGVCAVVQGPGLTNALTGLVAARKARTPLVCLVGNTPTFIKGHPKEIDQPLAYRLAGVASELIVDAADGVAQVRRAFQRAPVEGPIAVDLPADVLDRPCDWDEPSVMAPPTSAAGQRPGPADVYAVADAIERARRPVILAGRGAVRADARAGIECLAERAGALLGTTLPAKGLFEGSPRSLGVVGAFSSRLTRELVGRADCVLVLGSSLNHFVTDGGALFADAHVVQVDLDPGAIGANTPVQAGVVADARALAEDLTAALERRGFRAAGYATLEVLQALAKYRREDEFTDVSGPDGMDPRTLMLNLERIIPRDRTLVVDGGHCCGFPSMYLSVPDPAGFIFALDFGAVGNALGTALGAAVGAPSRLTVLSIGDGGLMMTLGDLETAVRYRLPLLVLVVNDGAYGAEMHYLQMLGMSDREARFSNPEFADVARALGADGLTVRSVEDLQGLEDRLASLQGPLVLDCKVTPAVRAAWLEEKFAIETLAGRPAIAANGAGASIQT